MSSNKSTAGKVFRLLIKLGISLLAIAYVWYKINEPREVNGNETSALQLLGGIPGTSFSLVVIPALMVFLNLGLEAMKWRVLIREYYPDLGYFKAFQAVFAGMTTGIFTPNRLGEYAGRVLFLEPGHRLEATVLTFFDRLSQMFVTLSAGALALIWFFNRFRDELINDLFGTEQKLLFTAIVSILFLSAIILLAYRPRLIFVILEKVGVGRSWVAEAGKALKDIDKKKLLTVTLLSLARFFVFSSQYYILMLIFGYEGSAFEAYGMISLVFLLKSLIPFIGLSEIGVRESAAMIIMGWFGVGILISFSSTLLLYLINIAFPSIVGIIFVYGLKLRFRKSA